MSSVQGWEEATQRMGRIRGPREARFVGWIGDEDPLAHFSRASHLLRALQLADSLFPSGAFSHSFGLEALVADGVVTSASDLAEVLEAHLREKLGRSDLPALLAAHAGAANSDLVREVDRSLSAVKLAREDRDASQRLGLRLATECARLAPSPALEALLTDIRARRTPGNAAVALGLAGRALELAATDTALLACYTTASAMVSAAMRLIRLGHGQAQAVLMGAHQTMAQAVATAGCLDWRDLRPCAPQLDVAAARHQRGAARLFAS